jgi:Uma2 family endonuclease
LIVANLLRELGSQLKGRPCKAYPSDMRVKIPGGQHYLYPDVIVVCGQSQFEDERKDTLLNPTLVIEVLSKSTEAYDRGDKFATYRKLDSLQECVLVSQERCLVEVFRRQPEALWLLSSHDDPKQVVSLPSIQCTLALSEVYDKVEIRA